MATVSALNLIAPTRRLLIARIKRRGSATVDELAADVFLSAGAVRQHLVGLSLQGLVEYHELRDGPGRPRHVYSLTSAAEALFPNSYGPMLVALLESLLEEDHAMQDRVIGRMAARNLQEVTSQLRGDTGQRLQSLTAYLEADGFLPELDSHLPEGATLCLNHCPLIDAATVYPGFCSAEEAALASATPGWSIQRIESRSVGDPRCTYHFSPLEELHASAGG
jgi:predicted ArsR family transcriptional regulator